MSHGTVDLWGSDRQLGSPPMTSVVIRADRIVELEVIVRKPDVLGRPQCDAIRLRAQSDRRVRRRREAMPVG